jgi:hypothetical protein
MGTMEKTSRWHLRQKSVDSLVYSANDILNLELPARGTEFAANSNSKGAVSALFEGDRWMIFANTQTGVLHWDFSVLGRFIALPVSAQA